MLRVHAGEPPGAGAPEEPQEERFGLIVTGVAQRDDMRAELGTRPLEKLVARVVRDGFDGPALAARPVAHIFSTHNPGQPEGRGDPGRELLVDVGALAKPMVEVRRACDGQFP